MSGQIELLQLHPIVFQVGCGSGLNWIWISVGMGTDSKRTLTLNPKLENNPKR